MRFIGDFPAKTDSKGRVFLPAAFRRVLGESEVERLVLRPDVFKRCLVLYPEQLWNEMLDVMRGRLSQWNASHMEVLRQFMSEAELVELDGNGRILLNKRKLQCAGIGQQVRFLGMDDRIEVWNGELCEEELSRTEDGFAANVQDLLDVSAR